MPSKKIPLKTSDRITIIGSTRDGKTTLLAELLKVIQPEKLVVMNTGADEKLNAWFGAPKRQPPKVGEFGELVHLAPPLFQDRRKFGKYMLPALLEGNCFVWIDELYSVATESQFSPALALLYQMGARRNVGIGAITQRAKRIPLFSINQADHIFVANVQGDDLAHLERETQKDFAELVANRKPYQFIYYSRHDGQPPRYI